jgi:hypothetical protein
VALRKRLTRNRWGDPVLTIRVEGTHDVYRLSKHLERGQVEFARLGRLSLRSLRRQLGRTSFETLVSYYDGSLWEKADRG